MAQRLPRTHFNSSALVRVLTELVETDGSASKQSFAERLGQWLDIGDALALFSALDAGSQPAEVPSKSPAADIRAVRGPFTRVRAALVNSITGVAGAEGDKVRIELPVPAPNETVERAADFAPYHRYYLAHQREMAARIGPLRTEARTALGRRSANHARLAGLDAVLDKALSARERDLLATVPALLGRRFARLHDAHQARFAEAQAADDPSRWMQGGGWLAIFCADLRAVLLAELELRLQPVAGLLAALDNEVTGKQ
ncbi:DUF3348 domain-containing protein [Aromatoleum sp.]|uniref:DUF3348 domain-containing protein n=1 Tax=Aromatoleum sp. TaxID=2307007 RepID=UPI002FCADE42